MVVFTLPITVEPWDVRDGRAGNCSKCPVALAVLRALFGHGAIFKDVAVTASQIVLTVSESPDPGAPAKEYVPPLRFTARVPYALGSRIANFDADALAGGRGPARMKGEVNGWGTYELAFRSNRNGDDADAFAALFQTPVLQECQ